MTSGDADLEELVEVGAEIARKRSRSGAARRVARLREHALLERLRFLCILGSNLDEFFEIRVAGVKEQLRSKVAPPGMALPDVRALFARIGAEARALIAEQYHVLNADVLPALEQAGVRLVRRTEFTAAERAWVRQYFEREVRPLLTPIGLDPAHPFPQVVNKSLNFIVELAGRDAFGRAGGIAIVKAPRVVPRVIKLPPSVAGGDHAFVMLSSVIHAHLPLLFAGRDVVNYSQFRVTRDADLWIDEEEVKNLRQALQGELPQRQFGSAVRLEVAAACPDRLAGFLLQQFELDRRRPLSLRRAGEPRAARLADRRGRHRRAQVPAVPARRARRGSRARPTSSRRSGRTTSCCTTRTSRSTRWSSSSAARPTTRTSSRSSRPSTGPASIRC